MRSTFKNTLPMLHGLNRRRRRQQQQTHTHTQIGKVFIFNRIHLCVCKPPSIESKAPAQEHICTYKEKEIIRIRRMTKHISLEFFRFILIVRMCMCTCVCVQLEIFILPFFFWK